MKILITCKQFPHSKVIGGPIIIYNRIKHLSKNHMVSLAAFFHEEEKKYIPSMKKYCHDLRLIPLPGKRSPQKTIKDFFFSPVPPYFLRMHCSPEMAAVIADMVRKDKYDFVIAEYSVMGQFIHNNPLLPPVRRIFSVHECYYLARLKDYRYYRIGIKKIREASNLKGLKKYEFDMYRNADKVLTLTPQGREELLNICPGLDVSIVPHGVDVDHFTFSVPEAGEKNIVFVGNYLHYPNTDAVLYFYRKVWPYVKAALPDVKFYAVGQSPPPEVLHMAEEENIIVTGRVDDVVPYLRKSHVFICPVRLGGGFRGKILEAMAMGRPVVSTSLGAEGIPAQHEKNIFIGDTPETFAEGVTRLFRDRFLYKRVAENGRKLMEEKYAWRKGVKVLEGVLEEMIRRPPKNQGEEGLE